MIFAYGERESSTINASFAVRFACRAYFWLITAKSASCRVFGSRAVLGVFDFELLGIIDNICFFGVYLVGVLCKLDKSVVV